MRKVIVNEFLSLDGVAQAPGAAGGLQNPRAVQAEAVRAVQHGV